MKNNYRNNIGSVSHGTMRPEDLIPEFVSCLAGQRPLRREHRKLLGEIEADEIEQEDALEALFNALNHYAPPYFYFGAHPGDGSDYGFWLPDNWEEDIEVKVEDLSQVPKGRTGEVLHVNDHGNMTLYFATRGRLREVWSIV